MAVHGTPTASTCAPAPPRDRVAGERGPGCPPGDRRIRARLSAVACARPPPHAPSPMHVHAALGCDPTAPVATDVPRLFLRISATSVCYLRHDPMEQGPTEPHAGRSTFLLSSGGAGGGYY